MILGLVNNEYKQLDGLEFSIDDNFNAKQNRIIHKILILARDIDNNAME